MYIICVMSSELSFFIGLMLLLLSFKHVHIFQHSKIGMYGYVSELKELGQTILDSARMEPESEERGEGVAGHTLNKNISFLALLKNVLKCFLEKD